MWFKGNKFYTFATIQVLFWALLVLHLLLEEFINRLTFVSHNSWVSLTKPSERRLNKVLLSPNTLCLATESMKGKNRFVSELIGLGGIENNCQIKSRNSSIEKSFESYINTSHVLWDRFHVFCAPLLSCLPPVWPTAVLSSSSSVHYLSDPSVQVLGEHSLNR